MNYHGNDQNKAKTHAEDRNKILLNLQRVYTTHSYEASNRLDSDCNNSSRFSVAKDLLAELHPRMLREYGNKKTCDNCKLQLRRNMSEMSCDKILNSTERQKADIKFIQAIAWLKSAKLSMQDISVEEFHLVFHKQWNTIINNNRTDVITWNRGKRKGSPIQYDQWDVSPVSSQERYPDTNDITGTVDPSVKNRIISDTDSDSIFECTIDDDYSYRITSQGINNMTESQQEKLSLTSASDMFALSDEEDSNSFSNSNSRQFETNYKKENLQDDNISRKWKVDQQNRIADSAYETESFQIITPVLEDCTVKQNHQKENREEENNIINSNGNSNNCEMNEQRKVISSQWLSYTLDALNANDVAFHSVKNILSLFEDERLADLYMKSRYWNETLEKEAVDAVLYFSAIQKETNVYDREIVDTVTRIIEKILETTEFNKTQQLTHQLTIVLELCNSIRVCTRTIDYLICKLNSLSDKETCLNRVVSKFHLLFYALNICFEKYRFIVVDESNEYEELAIVNLWKTQFPNQEGLIKEETRQTREHRWLIILHDLTKKIAAQDFSQFAIQSRFVTRLLIDLNHIKI